MSDQLNSMYQQTLKLLKLALSIPGTPALTELLFSEDTVRKVQRGESKYIIKLKKNARLSQLATLTI